MKNKTIKQKSVFLLAFLFSLCIFCFVNKAQAAVYYFCDCGTGADGACVNGSDTNPGTESSAPLRTYAALNTKFNAMSAGDSVKMCKGGVFIPLTSLNWVNAKCVASNPCTLSDYTPTWANESTAKPKIKPPTTIKGIDFADSGNADHEEGYIFSNFELDGNGSSNPGIYFFNDIDNVTIDNLYIHGFGIGIHQAGGNDPNDGSDGRNGNEIIKNSIISNNSTYGILGAFSDSQILNNQFTGNGSSGNHHAIFWQANSGYEVVNSVISGNVITNTAMVLGKCSSSEILVTGSIDDLIIEGNTISEAIGGVDAYSCTGIDVRTNETSAEYFKNVIIRGNKLYDLGPVSIGMNACQNCIIENNEIVQNQSFFLQQGVIFASIRGRTGADIVPLSALAVRNNSIYVNSTHAINNNIDKGITVGCDDDTNTKCETTGLDHIITNNAIYYTGNNSRWNCFSLGLPYINYKAVDNNMCYYPNRPNNTTQGWQISNHSAGVSLSLISWRADSGLEGNSLIADPNYRAKIIPYSLAQSSSLASTINKGNTSYLAPRDLLNLTRDALPDIGAYEFLPLSIAPSLSNGMVGQVYSQIIRPIGGIMPYSNISKTGGTIPPGLTFDGTTGIINGTPTQKGTFKFTIAVTDSDVPSAVSISQEITLVITSSLIITTNNLPAVFTGAAYAQTILGDGGVASYHWDISSGSLPVGLSMDSDTGIISGIPTDSIIGTVTHSFTVRLTDSDSPQATVVTKELSIQIREALEIIDSMVPDPRIGVQYHKQFLATGSVSPYTWTISWGVLPEGLSLDSVTGKISGTPTSAGIFKFTMQVADSETIKNTAFKEVIVTTRGAYEADYYVCDCGIGSNSNCLSGDDSNDGTTPETAFRTYDKARDVFATLQPGQTIAMCRGGSFTFAMVDIYSSPRWLNYDCLAESPCTIQDYAPSWGDGSEGKPIVIQAAGNAFSFDNSGNSLHKEGYVLKNLEIKGLGNGGGINGVGYGVFIYNDTDDVLLENLTVSGFDLGIYFGAANAPGVDSDNENKRLVLQNSNIFNNSGQGFGGSCSDCVVDHNVFTNNGYARAVLSHNIYWTGVQEDRFTTGGRITNNILTQSGITNGICQGVELVAHGNHQNLTIEGNIIYEAIGKAGVGCYGIQTNAGYTSMEYFRNLRIANNKIWNVGAEAIGASSCSDCVIENNEIVQEQPLMQIVGINIPDKTEGTIDEKSTRITIRNNSMYFNNTETATGVSLVGYIPISQANSMQGSIVTNNTIHYVGNSTTFACFKYGADVNGVVPPTYTNFDSINNNNCYGPRSIAVARGNWVYDPTGLGTPYPSWSAWNTASGFDINSTSVNPNFKSVVYPYDLSVSSSIASGIDQGDANNTAESDLLGSLRDALPDLGAYEYLLPKISTSGISEAIVNLPFFKTVFGEGGIAPYVWNFISGNLPTGITFNSENQELSGTPTSLGIFDFVLGFFDSNSPTSQQASKDFSVNVVNSLNFSINTATIPDTVVGNAYETTLSASGGEEPYIWEVVSGQLPLGINLRADGTIGGVPTEAGDFVFVVLVTEASYGSSSSKQLTLSVDGPPLIISTTTLPNGLQNANYVTSLLTGGGKPEYHWSVVSGNLPDGLILQDNGTISGIPTQIGTNTIEFSVVDANSDTITKIISISINDPLSINIQTIPDALNGSVYETDFSAINGSAPYQWAIADGALPLGLNISEEGILSGTPTQNGTFVFTVIATESSWDQTATKQMTLFVQSPVSVATSSLPNTQKNSPYSQALVAIGGTEPYNWEVAGGRLPTGLTLNSSGLIAGTSSEIGAFAFTVIVDEASYHQTSSKNLYIVVSGEIGITQSVLPNAIEYSSYATALPVAGGLAPYVWALESGALPAGLVISNDGAIGGIPTEAGTFIFTVKATESGYGSTASQQLNLTVTEAAAPTPNIQVVEKVVKKIVKVEKKSSDKPNNENVVVVTQKCISDPAQDTAVIVSEQKQNNEDSAQKENTNNTSINQNADAVRNDSWLGKIKQVIYGWYNKMVVWSFGKNN